MCNGCGGCTPRSTLAKMAMDLIDRIDDYTSDPEPQYEPELEGLAPSQIRMIRAHLNFIVQGWHLDNPLEGS